jgi:hypothetical protein
MCSKCENSSAKCVYDTEENESRLGALKRKNQELTEGSSKWEQLFDFLKSQPDDVANETLQRLRRGTSPKGLLESIEKEGLSYTSPSQHATDRSFLPPTQSFLEFELVASHSNAYPSLVPLDVASVDLKLLGLAPSGTANTKWRRLFGYADTSFLTRSNTSSSSKTANEDGSPANLTIDPQNLIIGTFTQSTHNYVDDRLARFEIRRWTTVPITNRFAAEAMSLFFATDQAFLGFFDTDLFLDDLVDGRDRFCSPLLVNSLLAWSCVRSTLVWSPFHYSAPADDATSKATPTMNRPRRRFPTSF